MNDITEPSLAESWIAKAKIERDHLLKYPDCADREYRECLIKTYERYAREDEEADAQSID